MKNLHAFTVKFIGASNYRPSRVKITSERFNQSVTFSYDHAFNSAYEQAAEYLTKKGFNLIGVSEFKDGHMITSDTFQPLK